MSCARLCRLACPRTPPSHLSHPRLLQVLERQILFGHGRQIILFLGSEGIGIDLVEHQHRRLVSTTQFLQSLLHYTDLLLKVGVRDVYHMHQQISLSHLIEGALKALHQVRGQLTDKTDGISQQEGQVVDGHLSHCGIEGSKKLVLSKHLTLG